MEIRLPLNTSGALDGQVPESSLSLTLTFIATAMSGALIACALFYFPDPWQAMATRTGYNSTIASMLAAAVAAYALRKISTYPGVSAIGYLLPAFATCFGIAAAAMLAGRLPHSNAILILAFIGAMIASLVLLAGRRTTEAKRFYVIPGGRVDQLLSLANFGYLLGGSPLEPRPPRVAIVADLHYDLEPEWEQMIARAALDGVGVYHYKQIWENVTGRVQVQHLSENMFGSLLPAQGYIRIKRLTDFMTSALLIPVLAVPLIIVAVLIKLDSPGPAIFSQVRRGFRGHPFRIYKFRTMAVPDPTEDADHRDRAMTKTGDARITKLGRFLRRSRIDELPQIVNILRGEMSWIGPRPEAMELAEWYEREIPFYAYRHVVRPGITGWAQVNQGHVTGLEEIDAKVQYDFYYIKNFSYWIDMLIAMRSFLVLANGFGAR